MDKKEIKNLVKSSLKGYANGYNIAIDVALLVAGIKLRNKKLIAGATVATIGTAIEIWDNAVAPVIDEVKEEINERNECKFVAAE